MRKGAELAQTLPPEWVERLNQALFSSPEDAKLLEDPVILAACRRANRAELLHWANANLQRPGEPVQPTSRPTWWTRPGNSPAEGCPSC